ncbi:MAG: HAD-IA family hydrolase [Alphaproteobacteria bacterium]|nr:HAD-IA family hydrolase [Alphaproteobacteria bacterium]MDD9919370.1 HAD-IA family hydrolase [Alphaproteobacteria bacterium]
MTQYAYIFDLDRTLYPLDHPLFGHIWDIVDNAMMEKTGLRREEVRAKLKAYKEQKLDSFKSLAEEYAFELSDILIYPRHLDYGLLKPCVETRQLISNLSAKTKVVYTDAIAEHAELALSRLHLRDLFDAVYDIHFSDYDAKGVRDCFSHVLEDMQVEAEECVMIEDSESNLKVAKSMGMRTVLLTKDFENKLDFVDEIASDLPTWLRTESERVE